jgi:hypothetical protein
VSSARICYLSSGCHLELADLRRRKVVPHVAEYAPNAHWPNWLTEKERHDPGFALSQKKRKLIEKVFGWGNWTVYCGK